MRHVRVVLGLVAAACALGASATTALAAETTAPEFTASRIAGSGSAAFPLKLKGKGVGPQEFVFKKIHTTCQAAKVTGSVPSAKSKTISLTIAYKECTTGPIVIWGKITEVGMKFLNRSEYTLHFNGFVENEEEVEMKSQYLKCLVSWGSGVIPEKANEKPNLEYGAVLYKNETVPNDNIKHFPSGYQHKLMITNQFKGHELEWAEEGGGACEELELAEGEVGRYNGKLLVEVPSGNIEGPETG